MQISLQANVEQIINFGIDVHILSIVHHGYKPLYIRNNEPVTVNDSDVIYIPERQTRTINFDYKNCRYLHVISAAAAEIEIVIKSVFRAIHRGKTTPRENTVVDFREDARRYDVQNLSATETIYVGINSLATINGDYTIEIPPGMGFGDDDTVSKLYLISFGEARYQVIGRRKR